ncbi:MAG TPA: glycosyltransferase family 2 protein [Clostridia bacterium]|nr:glycosyltransferase family 2 protein [Clostridia bacterium]
MQKPIPVSVCIISGAEAHRIGRALDSVAGWTSETVIVLNEEVADGTDAVARQHGARVFREPWKGFVAQKNSVCDKATQPWILGLDADEAVSPELRDQILAQFAREPEAAGYSVPRRTFYFGRWIRHGDWYPDRCVRLWRRGQARWVGVDPHAALRVEGEVRKLSGDLLHYTSDTINHQVTKTVSYAEDFVRHCARTGRRITFWDLILRPSWRFLRAYFFKLGFLDGWQGYTIAWMTAFYTFLRYVKAREAQLQPASHPAPEHARTVK